MEIMNIQLHYQLIKDGRKNKVLKKILYQKLKLPWCMEKKMSRACILFKKSFKNFQKC